MCGHVIVSRPQFVVQSNFYFSLGFYMACGLRQQYWVPPKGIDRLRSNMCRCFLANCRKAILACKPRRAKGGEVGEFWEICQEK
jgi:hypothetical protein